jgi:hypothetical protein
MKKLRFTFKTTHPTGSYRSFYDPYHTIKFKKQTVGTIDHKTNKISLMVVKTDTITDNNPNCEWKSITLAVKPKSLQEAKDFLNENVDRILERYTLHGD